MVKTENRLTMATETNDYSRQLKYLLVLGDEILKEDGVFKEGSFFLKLQQFISFYKEMRLQFLRIVESQKSEEIPINLKGLQTHLKFVNYQYLALPIFCSYVSFSIDCNRLFYSQIPLC